MKICVTYVDSISGIPCDQSPMPNGPKFPDVKGFVFEWANRTQWPTNYPLFYGTCDDDADILILGVVKQMTDEEYQDAKSAENEIKAYQVRAERNNRIALAQNRADRALRLARMGFPHENIEEIDAHIQALADIPSQPGFPWDVEWPN